MTPNLSAEYAVCIKHGELIDQEVVGQKSELVPGELVKIIVLNKIENLDRLVVQVYDRDNKNFGKRLYQCDKAIVKILLDNVWAVASNLREGTNVILHLDLPGKSLNVQFLIKFFGNGAPLEVGHFFGLDITDTLISDVDKYQIRMKYSMANYAGCIIRADQLIEALVLENLPTIDIETTKPFSYQQNNNFTQSPQDENGIVCPSPTCNSKYSFIRGGCIHLTCTQCKHEFCFGCRQPFLRGPQCKKYNDCATKGMHAHHPRNCMSILRDCSIASLKNVIKKAKIDFNGIPPNGTTSCQIPIQKETPNGFFIDVLCEKATHNANIGLCEQHYKESIIGVIFKAKLDPVNILDLGECQGELIRNNVALPKRLAIDSDAAYRKKCIAIIKQLLPIV